MKKLVYISLILLLFCGCGKKEEQIEILFDEEYYSVATPYKEAIANLSIRSYDKNEVETMLMQISSSYFKTNNSLYQDGQYLTKEEIEQLLDEYNNIDPINIDNITINPKYVTTIYEQNYLATNNNLKGISLAIVLDNKQEYGTNSYKLIDEEIVLDYGIEVAKNLVNYMRSKEELKTTKLIVGIYLESNSTLKGSFKYIGSTEKDDISMQYVNYNYQLLDSNYIMNQDIETYNIALALKNSLSDYKNLYTNIVGLYKNNDLLSVEITINSSYLTQAQILNISHIITQNISHFNQTTIKVYLKSNNKVKAFLNKKSNENKIETYILEE